MPAHAAVSGRIDVVQVNGLLDPANAALIHSSIRNAEKVHSTVLVFQLDGSGAIDTNVESLLHDFRNAKVPIAVWVGPSHGAARGASALLALAAGYTAVAPGAHLGPVDPVYYDDPSRTVPGEDVLKARAITAHDATLQDFV